MSDRLHLKGLVLFALSCSVLAFDFSFTAPTSCDNLNVSWSGGTGPFSLLIAPLFNVPQNISIPDSAFDSSTGNIGSFSLQLSLPPGRQFLLTMSDSTGFESGGTSNLLTVGSSVGDASCNTTEPHPDFFFDTTTALQQCRTFTFSGYSNARQPVRILGLIPLGQSFELDPPSGSTSFDWIADVSQGTDIVFIMIDSLGRQGGDSDVTTVGATDDFSCINASSPHSTAQASSTQTGGSQPTETVQMKTGSQTGAIAGATVGGLALVSLTLLVSFYCLRRRKRPKNDTVGPHRPPIAFIGSPSSRISRVRSILFRSGGRMRRAHSSFDLLPPAALHRSSLQNSPLRQANLPLPEDEYMPNPYILPSEAAAADGHSTYHRSSSTYPREPPPSVYHAPGGGAMTYTPSHSRSHSRTYTDGQVSPSSVVSNPYSQGNGHSRRPSVPNSTSSSVGEVGSTKASHAGTARNTRFILHTDADDVASVDEESDLIELPPMYTDRGDSRLKSDSEKELNWVSS